jgi:hypothetical protein
MRLRQLWLLLPLFMAGCEGEKKPDEIYVFPDGFKGWAIVFYERPEGEILRKFGNANVFYLPEDGVMKVRTKEQSGWHEVRFLYGDRFTEIAKMKPVHATGMSVHAHGSGIRFNADKNKNYSYSMMFVGTENEFKNAELDYAFRDRSIKIIEDEKGPVKSD